MKFAVFQSSKNKEPHEEVGEKQNNQPAVAE